MGFIERAFTPPGTGAYVPPPAAPAAAAAAAPAPVAEPPAPPTMPQAPKPPPQFMPGMSPQKAAVSAKTATSMLGAAATAGQQAKKSLLGA